ncbi:MAG: ribonuclease HI family protein [Candidatus Pacebacteria bacterium]|jgi:ribonuclease HI|nr:ribonuclease HI family protein [Candidatus Paceibacterota bacterium]
MAKKIKVYTDGGSRGNPGKAGAGVYIEDELGKEFYRESKFLGRKTNNEAEYLAFLMAVDCLLRFELKNPGLIESAEFFLDSKLVVEQINRRWKIKKAELRQLAESSWKNLSALPYSITIKHLLREENQTADQLANEAMDRAC